MELSIPQWGQIITLMMIAMSLGMDAFSLGLGLGMKRIPLQNIIWFVISIGIFHTLMPLIGMLLGQFLSSYMKDIATTVGGGMLCFLGANILFNLFKLQKKSKRFQINSVVGVILFSLGVSIDSLSAGLSLGLFSADMILAVLLFGSVGALLAGSGLCVGRFVGHWVGSFGEAIAGVILILLGSKFLW